MNGVRVIPLSRAAASRTAPRALALSILAAPLYAVFFAVFFVMFFVMFIGGFFEVAVEVAHADGIFRWIDDAGRVHYGSHPPKNAGTAVPIAGRSFSRYSASRALKPYHSTFVSSTTAPPMGNGANEGDEPVKATVSRTGNRTGGGFRSIAPGGGSRTISGRTIVGRSGRFRSITPVTESGRNDLAGESLNEPSLPAGRSISAPERRGGSRDGTARASIREESLLTDLSQGALELSHDEKRRVTKCRVPVQNTSSIPAQGIIVSFEFQDGTLIPGVGPDSLAPGEEATYAIPDEFLPVVVKNLPDGSELPKPQVSVKASG